jgi:hypothetical protein
MSGKNKNSKGKKGKKGKGTSSFNVTNPPISLVQYRGPISVPLSLLAEDMISAVLTFEAVVQASAAGLISLVFSSDPKFVDTTNAAYALTQYQNLYRQQRTLGFSVEYVPNTINAINNTPDYFPVQSVLDYESATPIVSYGVGATYPSVLYFALNQFHKREIRMASTDNAQFTQTGVTLSNPFFIKMFSVNLSANQDYGRFLWRGLVQFKGRI